MLTDSSGEKAPPALAWTPAEETPASASPAFQHQHSERNDQTLMKLVITAKLPWKSPGLEGEGWGGVGGGGQVAKLRQQACTNAGSAISIPA